VDAVEGVQGLVDEVLGVLRSVRVGGVDEIDTKLRQSLEDGDRCVAVFRRAPNAIASDPHGAKAETSNFDVAAQLEGAGGTCGRAHAIGPFLWVAPG